MRKLLVKAVIFASLLAITDILVGFVLQTHYSSASKTGALQIEEIWRHLNEEKGDVLILGASEAHHHYNSQLITDKLNLSVSNCGFNGAEVCYTDFVLSSFVERQLPKIVILDISDGMMNGAWLDKNSNIRLFYNQNDLITYYFDHETDWKERLKMMSKMYRYNGELLHLASLNRISRSDKNGYIPLKGNINDVNVQMGERFIVDSVELKHLEHIVDICKKKDIQLFLVISPKGYVNKAFCEWINRYAFDRNILLSLQINDPYWYEHPELFKDRAHLNQNGADTFTNRICKFIKDNGM